MLLCGDDDDGRYKVERTKGSKKLWIVKAQVERTKVVIVEFRVVICFGAVLPK